MNGNRPIEKKAGLKDWLHLFRIWSLTATVMPILVVGCFNAAWPRLSGTLPALTPVAFGLHLAVAFLSCGSLQLACNLLNTWGDFFSGVDTQERRSSRPELLDGIVTPRSVLWGAVGFVVLGTLAGGYLLSQCFSSALLVYAVLGVLGSVNYSTGIRFKYRGLGVPFVFLLMGPLLMLAADLCLGGALHCLAGSSAVGVVWVGCALLPISSLVAGILHANDMRDMDDDASAGIVTLATCLGAHAAAGLFALLHLLSVTGAVGAFILAPYVHPLGGRRLLTLWPLLLPCALAPLTARVLAEARRGISSTPHQKNWRGLLPQTARLHLLTGLLQGLSFLLIR